jgi:hypothetical protein
MAAPSHEVEVTIYDGPTTLVTRKCRLVHLRDGRSAVIWRGLAFPVLPGDRIDVAGDACPINETVPHANAPGAFGVIDGQSEAYVLIAGGFIDAEIAAGKLRTAGLEVLRTGRYLGDAIDHLDADWFVRIVRPVTPLDLAKSLEPILGQAALHPPPVAIGDPRARLLTAELLAARSREEGLRTELVRLQTAVHADSEATAQIAALQDMLAVEQRLREAAEEAADTVLRQPLPVPSGRIADEVRDVLTFLLPNISMLRDSIKVITLEFATRRGVWRALGELASAKGIPRDWKKIRGADAWWERHLSDGRDDTGRIYARRAAGFAWEVLISHKTEQVRDIAWLCRQ